MQRLANLIILYRSQIAFWKTINLLVAALLKLTNPAVPAGLLSLSIFALVFTFGCKKDDPTPMPPVIKFIEGGLSDDGTYAVVKFEFFDNDGDLGLKQEENQGEHQYNLFIDYYEKYNGVWQIKSPVITYNSGTNEYDTTVFHLRVPFIQNKEKTSLKGETYVKLIYNNFSLADTFKYEMILKDRAFHLSNKIESSEIFK